MDPEAAQLLSEAYGLLLEFWDVVENSLEGEHPSRERLDAWLSRIEEVCPSA
jgi:hypothetical protein